MFIGYIWMKLQPIKQIHIFAKVIFVYALQICDGVVFLQSTRVEAQRYYELREKDTLKFGNSRSVHQPTLIL